VSASIAFFFLRHYFLKALLIIITATGAQMSQKQDKQLRQANKPKKKEGILMLHFLF